MRFLILALTFTVVLAPTKRPGKNLFLLIDTSGSMDTTLSLAIAAAREIAEQPLDDGKLNVLAFDSGVTLAPGGWIELPDQERVKIVSDWLATRQRAGMTFLNPALQRAMLDNHDNLSLVIISDGQFNETTPHLVSLIKTLQENRVKRGRTKVTIGCVGVGFSRFQALEAIARAGEGGFLTVSDVPETGFELVVPDPTKPDPARPPHVSTPPGGRQPQPKGP